MTKLAKKQKCVLIQGGIEVWVDEEKVGRLAQDLVSGTAKGFIQLEGRTFNSFHIVGVFSPEDLEEMKRRKNGDFKCDSGNWHVRFEKCECELVRTASDGTKERFVKGTGWIKEL